MLFSIVLSSIFALKRLEFLGLDKGTGDIVNEARGLSWSTGLDTLNLSMVVDISDLCGFENRSYNWFQTYFYSHLYFFHFQLVSVHLIWFWLDC